MHPLLHGEVQAGGRPAGLPAVPEGYVQPGERGRNISSVSGLPLYQHDSRRRADQHQRLPLSRGHIRCYRCARCNGNGVPVMPCRCSVCRCKLRCNLRAQVVPVRLRDQGGLEKNQTERCVSCCFVPYRPQVDFVSTGRRFLPEHRLSSMPHRALYSEYKRLRRRMQSVPVICKVHQRPAAHLQSKISPRQT